MNDFWAELERPAPETALVDGVELRRGSRVMLRPRAGADVLDLALGGRVAVVEAIEEDIEGAIHLSVTLLVGMLLAFGGIVVRELPAIRRYINIERM